MSSLHFLVKCFRRHIIFTIFVESAFESLSSTFLNSYFRQHVICYTTNQKNFILLLFFVYIISLSVEFFFIFSYFYCDTISVERVFVSWLTTFLKILFMYLQRVYLPHPIYCSILKHVTRAFVCFTLNETERSVDRLLTMTK